MLDADIIRPSSSPFASPVILVNKSDGTYRFCTDFRGLNSLIVLDSNPLPSVIDSIESLGASQAKYFSTLDLQSGYWQIKVEEKSKPMTAFITHDGLFEYQRLPFGIASAPNYFSSVMGNILQGLTWDICLVYLDDIIVFSKDFNQHLSRLRKVFERIRKAKLTFKPSKCFFGKQKVRYLGHIVSKHGIEPIPDKCKAVQDFPVPNTVKKVRSFLGLAGYYRRFVKNFSRIAAPMTELTKKDQRFIWSKKCQEAFDELKCRLSSPPILAYPDYSLPYILQTDSSQEAIGMILSQIQNGKERVIAYGGKRLNPAERNYSITELEALGVLSGLRHFDPYLRGNKVKIETDHSALKWLLSQKQPKGRIARWVCYLQSFNFEIVHRPGKAIPNVDSLSRRSYPSEPVKNDQELVNDDTIFPPELEKVNVVKKKSSQIRLRGRRRINTKPVFTLPSTDWNPIEVRKQQLQDPKIKDYITYFENGDIPDEDNEARKVLLSKDAYVMNDGVLYHLLDSKTKNTTRQIDELRVCLVVPQTLKYDVLKSVHGDTCSAHYGTSRTYTTLRLKYFWEGMYQECRNWVLSCEECNTRKHPVRPTKAELQPLPTARMNERWAMDLITLPLTTRGNRYLLTFTEYSSRYVEAFAIPNMQAGTLAKILVDEICFRYGCPRHILSDLGANFISQVVAESCKVMGIERLFTTPYHPQTDGMLEKFNETLCKNLAMYVNEQHDDWDTYVRAIVYSYNTSVCVDSTQYSPYFLMFGHEPFGPLETVLPNLQDLRQEVKETVLKLHKVREVAKQNLEERKKKMKENYDKTANPVPFEPGQLVWIYFPEVKVGGSKKFFHNYSGPYILLEKTSPTNFRVAHAHNNQPLKNQVHVNRMKMYHHRSITPHGELPNFIPADTDAVEDINPNDHHKIPDRDNKTVILNQGIPKNVQPGIPQNIQPGVPIRRPSLPIGSQPLILNPLVNSEPRAPNLIRSTSLPNVVNNKETKVDPEMQGPRDVLLVKDVTRPMEERRETLQPAVTEPEEYEIDKIIRGKYNKDGKLEYLIQWKGFGKKDRTYEPVSNLNEAAKEYVSSHKIPISGKRKQSK